MKLFCILVLSTIWLENEAKLHKSINREMAANIAHLIHLVNRQRSDDELLLEERSESPMSFAEDYFMVRTDSKANEDVELIKSSDKQANRYKLHIIKNPGVLDDFKKRIHKSYHASDEDNNDFFNLEQRRSALFRLDSVDNALRTQPNENIIISNRAENRKQKRNRERDRNNVDVYLDEDVPIKKETDDIPNAWDVITKNYDWKLKRERSKKNKMADDWDKVTKKYDWDKNTKKYDRNVDKSEEIDFDSNEMKSNKKDFSKNTKKKADKLNSFGTQFKLTTRQRKSEVKSGRNKAYIPEIPSYDRPRKKSRVHIESSSLFGRTPIPFIGRHGIYED